MRLTRSPKNHHHHLTHRRLPKAIHFQKRQILQQIISKLNTHKKQSIYEQIRQERVKGSWN